MAQIHLFLIILLFPFIAYSQDTVYFIFDEPCNDSLPKNFRMTSDELMDDIGKSADITGLSTLNASGSSEFCRQSLKVMLSKINQPYITIVDLRQESHGFVNGLCVSWYGKYDWGNVGLTQKQVEADQFRRLDSILQLEYIYVTQILKKDKATNNIVESKQVQLKVESVQTEELLIRQYIAEYFRITSTDHRKPETENVDRFIQFVNSLKSNTWLHFHCHAGDGRTTTFMAMYDMMRNSKQVGLHDILQRQYLLGGIDLAKDDDYPDFDKKYAIERTEFLRNFYDYCKANTDGFKTLYSEWVK